MLASTWSGRPTAAVPLSTDKRLVSDPWNDLMCPLPETVFPVDNAVAVDDAISGSDDDSVATDNQPRRGRGRG